MRPLGLFHLRQCSFNKSFQFVPALEGRHWAPFPPLRCKKVVGKFAVSGKSQTSLPDATVLGDADIDRRTIIS
jgi:hypothetical protein